MIVAAPFNAVKTISVNVPPLQGHKRAPSDVSVASSEDEKIPLSPTILESVPEKGEPRSPIAGPNEIPVANHVTSFVEESTIPAAAEHTEKALVNVGGKQVVPEEVESGRASSIPPAHEMEQLAIASENEKEDDTAEVPANSDAKTEIPKDVASPEKRMITVKESITLAEEDPYKHVMVTLPSPDDSFSKEKDNEKPAVKPNTEDEKILPDKAKDDSSDSGRSSTADNSSLELNLSISSFLSKTKEPGSVSIQVPHSTYMYKGYL